MPHRDIPLFVLAGPLRLHKRAFSRHAFSQVLKMSGQQTRFLSGKAGLAPVVAAAEIARRWVDHGQRITDRHGGIDRIAALLQDINSNPRC